MNISARDKLSLALARMKHWIEFKGLVPNTTSEINVNLFYSTQIQCFGFWISIYQNSRTYGIREKCPCGPTSFTTSFEKVVERPVSNCLYILMFLLEITWILSLTLWRYFWQTPNWQENRFWPRFRSCLRWSYRVRYLCDAWLSSHLRSFWL